MKIPSLADQARSMDIRIRSKCGENITTEEREWNIKIYKKYQEWYSATEKEVFERTKPLSSR